ncbi:MAG: hypothetical protein GX442_16830 [Candidatus Riflebacteria bacterium]|nr:hypothetical protein [Candidatus Riflebacteria bacterium]
MQRLALGFLVVLVLAGGAFAQESPNNDMAIFPAMDKLAGMIGGTLDSSQTLGTPVKVGDTTIIPVLAKGLGFGMGEGLLGQEETAKRPDKGDAETTKDRHGIGAGAGGFMRPIAILVIDKDGRVQIHRLQESALAQVVKELMPAIQRAMAQKMEMFKMRREEKPGQPPAQP